jgi:glycosyltransferase involved in cell wall biosynthesis
MLSAVIITLNEARNIGRCLKSLHGVADEIVVLDAGSTDQTQDICEKFGVRFFQREWTSYADAKNYANQLAVHPYILSLDADEALSEELKTSILAIKDRLHGAYRMNRLTNYAGHWVRHGGWYPDAKVRLFPQGKAHWEGDFVHERLVLSPDIGLGSLKGDLLHYSFYSKQEHHERIDHYSKLAAQKQFKAGQKPSWFKQYLRPLGRFVKIYFLKGGWREGKTGWHIATGAVLGGYLRQKYLRRPPIPLQNRKTLMVNLAKGWGGGEKWFLTVGEELNKRDWEVHWLCYPDSPLHQRLQKQNLPHTAIPLRFLNQFRPSHNQVLKRLIRSFQPSTVLLNASHELKTAGWRARKMGVPKVIFRRGVSYALSANALNRWFIRTVPTHFLANSLATFQANTEAFPHLEHLPHLTLNNGIDPQPWKADRERRVSHRIGMSARLSPEKGIDRAIDAIAILKQQNVAAELMVLGEGKERSKLEKQIAELGLEQQVQLKGFVENVPAALNSGSVFLFTPRLGEGTSLALIEAMLLELPCVVMDSPAMVEVVVDGETGFVVPDGDVGALAEALRKLLVDEPLRLGDGPKGTGAGLDAFYPGGFGGSIGPLAGRKLKSYFLY